MRLAASMRAARGFAAEFEIVEEADDAKRLKCHP
jgi:hypothetical protein